MPTTTIYYICALTYLLNFKVCSNVRVGVKLLFIMYIMKWRTDDLRTNICWNDLSRLKYLFYFLHLLPFHKVLCFPKSTLWNHGKFMTKSPQIVTINYYLLHSLFSLQCAINQGNNLFFPIKLLVLTVLF